MTDLFDEPATAGALDDALFGGGVPSEFIKFEDLAGGFRTDGTRPGRGVLFYPETVQYDIEGDQGTYNAVYGRLVVLDGELTEKVTELPFVIEGFKISGAFITPGLLAMFDPKPGGKLGGREREYELIPKNPVRYFVAGLLDSIKNRRGTLSWKLLPLSDSGIARAKAYHARYEREKAASDPFRNPPAQD